MTRSVVGLLTLRPTEFIEMDRLAQALKRAGEFEPVFFVHRGSPVFHAHREKFESGDIRAVVINPQGFNHEPGGTKAWKIARLLLKSNMAFVDATFNHYLAQSDQLRVSEKIFRENNLSMLVVGEDGVGADLASMAACRRLGKPSMVLPYEYSTIDQPLHFMRSDRALSEATTVNTLPRRLLAAARPRWVMESRGERFLRLPVNLILADEALGIAPHLPWTVHGGSADAVATESDVLAKTYAEEGLQLSKIVVTGSFGLDRLKSALDRRRDLRDKMVQRHSLDAGRSILLCAFPPDYFPGRSDLEFDGYLDMIRFWVSSVRAVTTNVVFQCHPAIAAAGKAQIAAIAGTLATDDVVELIAAADALVTSVSSIIRFAIVAGLPVANYDVYRFNYRDYKTAPMVLHAGSRREFRDSLESMSALIPQSIDDDRKAGAQADAWGRLDGLGGERILRLISSLLRNGGAPDVYK